MAGRRRHTGNLADEWLNFVAGGAAGSFNPGHDWHVIALRDIELTAPPNDDSFPHFEMSTDVRYLGAFGGKADISQRLPNNRDL